MKSPTPLESVPFVLAPRQSLADQIADAIVERIATGVLKSGERLVETELAEWLSVSRVPVREALKVLEVQGIAVAQASRGVAVADFGVERIRQVRELRLEIEKVIARQVGGRIGGSPSLALQLDGIIDQMELASARCDAAGINRLDLEFHRTLCRMSENATAAVLWDALARHIRIIFGLETLNEANLRPVVEEHRLLKDAILSNDAQSIYEELRRHINGRKWT